MFIFFWVRWKVCVIVVFFILLYLNFNLLMFYVSEESVNINIEDKRYCFRSIVLEEVGGMIFNYFLYLFKSE